MGKAVHERPVGTLAVGKIRHPRRVTESLVDRLLRPENLPRADRRVGVKLAVDVMIPWDKEEPLRLDRKALGQGAHEFGCPLVLRLLAGECDVTAHQHEAERSVLLGPDSGVLQQSAAGHVLGEAVPAAPEMKVRDVQPGEPVDQNIPPQSAFLVVAVIMRVGLAMGLVVRPPGNVTNRG